MAFFEVHPWARFLTGMLTGCWIGVLAWCAGTLLLMGKRVRQLETINLLLRSKLKVLERPPKAGLATGIRGAALVMPRPGTIRWEQARGEQAHRPNTAQRR